jgi:hypothetical protein
VIELATTAATVWRPVVANVRHAERFVVAWDQPWLAGEELAVRAVSAADGSLSPKLTAAVNVEFTSFGIAGEAQDDPDHRQALLVYVQNGTGVPEVRCTRLLVPTAGALSHAGDVVLFSSGGYEVDAPRISQGGGVLGRYLAAWRSKSLFENDWEIHALALDRTGHPITPLFDVTDDAYDAQAPAVDGGASFGPSYAAQFVVAYERRFGGLTIDLQAKALAVSGGTLVETGWSTVASPPAPLWSYDVAWTPGRATAVWVQDMGGAPVRIDTRDLDATDASPIGPVSTVAVVTPKFGDVKLALASVQSGGVEGKGEGLIAFGYDGSTLSRGDVFGQRFDALTGGSIADVGGGCGAGGAIVPYGDPAIGNGYLQLALIGADPLAPFTIMNLSSPAAPLVCGPCAWLPFQLETVKPTLAGTSQVILTVPAEPALAGQPFQVQFTTPTPSSSPCGLAPGFSLSNRIEIVLGG